MKKYKDNYRRLESNKLINGCPLPRSASVIYL